MLVSNAGSGTISPLDDLRVEEWDQMVDTNIKGVLHGIGAALPVFRAGTGQVPAVSRLTSRRMGAVSTAWMPGSEPMRWSR
ncbi:hypothetical protein GCM10010324_54350 [Streptomyces hiroshimensis]|uniref:Uncharacterized protein n=1 Tax=Streptomyces hiroshimensis TaxID=66424 RepID=A0ABQ2Z427_9ACTN|nr:hypothetical protein GCM10010324_54350 [Streptomyces hiroshimensis]